MPCDENPAETASPKRQHLVLILQQYDAPPGHVECRLPVFGGQHGLRNGLDVYEWLLEKTQIELQLQDFGNPVVYVLRIDFPLLNGLDDAFSKAGAMHVDIYPCRLPHEISLFLGGNDRM